MRARDIVGWRRRVGGNQPRARHAVLLAALYRARLSRRVERLPARFRARIARDDQEIHCPFRSASAKGAPSVAHAFDGWRGGGGEQLAVVQALVAG